MNNKQKNEKEKQANKVLYITVAAMLAVMAVIVAVSSALSRATRPEVPGTSADSTPHTGLVTDRTDPPEDTRIPADSLPVIADPDKDTEAGVSPSTPAETPAELSLPVDGILSEEFSDKVLVYSSTMEDYRTHMGMDITASLGDKVYAAAAGKVADIWYDPMMGHCVRIEHKGGVESIYKNLADELCDGIGVGSSVLVGDAIGYVGESAMVEIAEEPHLHFEVKLDGKYVDPLSCMTEAAKSRLNEDRGYEN